jgi:glycosyltransferase involved in cell wall biosynthesis
MTAIFPRITVVTPSFNHGQFLRQTIESVLAQGYPNLEYIVIDGASTDNSPEVLSSYSSRLAFWSCEPDHGISDAINKGFARATGDWLCWINADDVQLPGALHRTAAIIQAHPGLKWISGGVLFADKDLNEWGRRWSSHTLGRPGRGSNAHWITGTWLDLVCEGKTGNFLSQPSSFWRREAWERVGILDRDLRQAMDYEYWIRMARAGLCR